MAEINHPLTVKWVLFGFKGRIGRKSFILAALLLLIVQLILFTYASRYASPSEHPGQFTVDGSGSAIVIFAMLGSWIATAWAILALAVKRLHDLSLPVILGVVLLMPGIAFFGWLFLAVAPSKQETNEHGPVPFPKI